MSEGFLPLMAQSLAALAAVLAIFAGLVWLLRRLQLPGQGGNAGAAMQVVRRLPLDSKHSLVEVAYEGRHYLIGLSPTGMTSIFQPIEHHAEEAEAVESQ